MKVCVCFRQRMLNALLGLRNPYKERLCTLKKNWRAWTKEIKCYAIPRNMHAQAGFLLKLGYLQFAAGFS